MGEENHVEIDLVRDLPPSQPAHITFEDESGNSSDQSEVSSIITTVSGNSNNTTMMNPTTTNSLSQDGAVASGSYSDSSSLPTIPSTQPKMWPLPYFSFSRLIRGPRKTTTTEMKTSQNDNSNNSSDESVLSIPYMVDPSEHPSEGPSSPADEEVDNHASFVDEDIEEHLPADIEEQRPVDEPVPLTIEERMARLYSYPYPGPFARGMARNNQNITIDAECASNASSSDSSDSDNSMYSTTLRQLQHQRQRMMTRSILFPSLARSSDQDCTAYLFSVFVGAVAIVVFGVYALVVVAGLG